MTALDFIVNKLEVDKGKGLVTSLMVSTVNGPEFCFCHKRSERLITQALTISYQ